MWYEKNYNHQREVDLGLRTADTFGIERLILGGPPVELGRKFTKTSRATEQSVAFEQLETLLDKIIELKARVVN